VTDAEQDIFLALVFLAIFFEALAGHRHVLGELPVFRRFQLGEDLDVGGVQPRGCPHIHEASMTLLPASRDNSLGGHYSNMARIKKSAMENN